MANPSIITASMDIAQGLRCFVSAGSYTPSGFAAYYRSMVHLALTVTDDGDAAELSTTQNYKVMAKPSTTILTADPLLSAVTKLWETATGYDQWDVVWHGASGYIALSDHTSAAGSEPGTGVDWETYWVATALHAPASGKLLFPVNLNTEELALWLATGSLSGVTDPSGTRLGVGKTPRFELIRLADDDATEEATLAQGSCIIVADVHSGDEGDPIFISNYIHNRAATARPSVGDDEDDYYTIGSKWQIVSGTYAGEVWTCLDATAGAAVWALMYTDASEITVDETSAASADTGTMQQLLDGIAAVLLSLTGAADWFTASAKTLLQYLPLSGGTMSGAIAMGTNKITGLGNGSSGKDAVNKDQLDTMLPLAGGTMSGAIAMGSNKITGLGNASADSDVPNLGQVQNILYGSPWKANCQCAATDPLPLGGAYLAAGIVHDGHTLAEGDRIFLQHQGDATENGIYVIVASGTATRADDFATGASVAGAVIQIEYGTLYAEHMYQCTNDAGSDVVDVDLLAFQVFFGGSAVTSVHGRTGPVVAATSDYDADQIDVTPAGDIVATNVQAALEELDGEKAALTGEGEWTEQATDLAAPTAGWKLYFKAAGLYLRSAAGTVYQVALLSVANTWTALQTFSRFATGTATSKTVSGGTLTVDAAAHVVSPETGTTDDVATISGLDDGEETVLTTATPGTNTITYKHGTGNLSIVGAADLDVSHGAVRAKRVGSTVYLIGGGGGGGITAVSVTDIDDPSTELNALAGTAKGETVLCYETAAGADEWTLYAWDDADSGAEDVPRTVDGSSGMWVAIAGKYRNGRTAADIPVAATPSNYTAATADVEAHLAGIDTAIGTIGTGGFLGTSTTSLLIEVASKTFTTQASLSFAVGSRIRAASDADPSNWMEGVCTSYSSTTLIVNIDAIGGSGTLADWNLVLAGQSGDDAAPAAFPLQFPAGSLTIPDSNGHYLDRDSGTNGTVYRMMFSLSDIAECVFRVPGDIDTSGTVTFRVGGYAATAAALKNVQWRFSHSARAAGESWDAAYTDEDSGDKACDATQDDYDKHEWTETVANLGWAADDLTRFKLTRIAATDELSGDYAVVMFDIEIPRA